MHYKRKGLSILGLEAVKYVHLNISCYNNTKHSVCF